MKIVCAESVLAGAEAFTTLGETTVLPDRAIRREHLLDADALVIRSKTRVTRELLDGTPVKFVGTATAGFDHIDIAACEALGIAWTAAPGCNATSVAEWLVAALLVWSQRRERTLQGRSIAVIGVGQVGSRVARRAEILGLRPLLNDPPRALAEGDPCFRPLDEVLPSADIVTLHVPLTDQGPFATRGMADCRFFEQLKPGALFVNASRGEVVDEDALTLALDSGQVSDAVLDVWQHEPAISPRLLERALLGTPHIAGYSWDGKLAGTVQVYQACCRFFEVRPLWRPAEVSPGVPPPRIEVMPDADASLRAAVRAVYDIERDDRALRGDGAPPGETLADRFERLRRRYPVRREFAAATLLWPGQLDDPPARRLAALGFQVQPAKGLNS
ncbi:MAG: 4-phosphoerythronate dehydrogenase [Kiritimatiellae bacterium]|nr:4-phosphoerythronate dehydrogenase [Kiritimatiellia bacterium]